MSDDFICPICQKVLTYLNLDYQNVHTNFIQNVLYIGLDKDNVDVQCVIMKTYISTRSKYTEIYVSSYYGSRSKVQFLKDMQDDEIVIHY